MTRRLAMMLALALGACAGSDSARVEYAAGVTVRSPELVTIEDDLYVLADADEPVFYTDGYYWLHRDNRWYRSRSYDRDWIYMREPAARLRVIDQPTAYVRYRARRQEARNIPPPPPRDPWRDDLRDRTDAPAVPPHQQPPLQPTEPVQPPPAYPRPPQQESPVPIDHNIDARAPRSPTSPAPRTDVPRAPDDRPTMQKDDRPPPAQDARDDRGTRGDSPRDERNQSKAEDKDKHEKHDTKKEKKRDY